MHKFLRPLCVVLLIGCWPVLAEEAASEEPPAVSQSDGEEAPAELLERPDLPERSEQDAAALQQRLDDSEQQQLETPNERFLALWLPANVGEPRGMVIILPGDNMHAAAPEVVAPLRRKLPDAGWHSLSLSLPDPLSDLPLPRPQPVADVPQSEDAQAAEPDATPPAATEEAAPAETAEVAPAPAPADETSTSETQRLRDDAMQAHTERMFARIDAAVVFANQRDAPRIILLGHGSGGYWAARFLKERPAPGVSGLLLVSPRVPAGFSPPLEELAPALSLPVGDLFYKDQAAERSAALRRLQASKRLKAANYRQVALKALPGNQEAEQEQLYRRARGWLELPSR